MGKPSKGNALLSATESIGRRGDTQGTETSKYQEEKSTEIPSVAASERGTAQTIGSLIRWGCRASNAEARDSRMIWKVQPEKVIALYTKSQAEQEVPEYRGTREIPWEPGGTTLQG